MKKKYRQIANFLGELAVNELPTLSTDMLISTNVVQVSEELKDLWHAKSEDWYYEKDEDKRSKLFKENLAWYKKNVEAVYLPEEIEIRTYSVIYDITDHLEEIKTIINQYLWDCDYSHYTCVEVVQSKRTNAVRIKLEYDK